jgi:hypothetical protein
MPVAYFRRTPKFLPTQIYTRIIMQFAQIFGAQYFIRPLQKLLKIFVAFKSPNFINLSLCHSFLLMSQSRARNILENFSMTKEHQTIKSGTMRRNRTFQPTNASQSARRMSARCLYLMVRNAFSAPPNPMSWRGYVVSQYSVSLVLQCTLRFLLRKSHL